MTKRISCIFLSLLLSGCNSGTPECNSKEAKNLVISVAHDEYKKQFDQLRNSQLSGGMEHTRFSILNVRTTAHQSSLDVYECAADLNMTLSGKTSSIPVTYNIQKTDDGKQFIVNVFGL